MGAAARKKKTAGDDPAASSFLLPTSCARCELRRRSQSGFLPVAVRLKKFVFDRLLHLRLIFGEEFLKPGVNLFEVLHVV